MARRNVSDWLVGYLQYVENTEPPLQFHTWCAISTIAGALQRRVWLNWEGSIYPNQYIMLVGNSGATRKGVALDKSRWFLENMPHISLERGNRVTKEQLAIDMSTAMSQFLDPMGKLRFQNAMTHICPELVVFLGQRDLLLLGWLTDWYDSLPVWENRTKTAGVDEIHNMCYNLLAGTAPDWISSMIPEEAMGGGFTSRCMFVYEERKRKVVSDPRMTTAELDMRARLLDDLVQISEVAGEVEVSPKALSDYTDWYEQQEADILDGNPPIREQRLQGYLSRRQTHCWKLSMALSFSRSNERVIKLQDMRRARRLLAATERRMGMTFGGVGRGRYSQALHNVIAYMQERGRATHSELLRQFRYDIDNYTLEIVVDNMKRMEILSIVNDSESIHNTIYTFIAQDEEPGV